MTDIVDWLRTRSGWFYQDGVFPRTAKVMNEAADEIERLRANFADACDKLAKENDANLKLMAENAALRTGVLDLKATVKIYVRELATLREALKKENEV